MAEQEFMRYAEFKANFSDFIFKQHAQWFHKTKLHGIRKAANVVMTFDGLRRAMYRDTFNHIRIDSALPKHFNAFQLMRLLVKYFYKCFANDLTLFFRVTFACKLCIKMFFRINTFYI